MSLLTYLGGGALLAALARWWRPRLGWGWIAGYWLLAGAFFAAPLLTSAVQAPADIAYQWRPWSEMAEAPVTPANALLSDIPLQMIPFAALVRDRLRRFEAPLWAGEMGAGQPLLGNAQSAPFSPFGLLTLALPPVRALPVEAALKLFLSLLGMHALLAALGAGRAGAAFAAIAFAFSVYSICWAYYPLGMAAAWLPGLMLGLVLLRRGERGGLAGLVACATGMALSGHPETLAHVALAAAVVAAALLAAGGSVPRRRFLGGLAAAAAITGGLAAPALLPVVEALPETVRVQLLAAAPRGVQPPPFSARVLRVVVDPLAFGSPRDGDWDADRAGPGNYNELCSGYAGLLALALAAAAALTLRGRPLAILAGGAAALAAALAVPPFLPLVRALPLLDHAANGRLRLLWVLAVAIAAGLGLEPLAARRGGCWAAAACGAGAALALAGMGPPAAPSQRAWWLATAGACGAIALAFLWRAVRRPRDDVSAAAAAEPPSDVSARAAGAAPGDTDRTAAWLPWLAVAALALDLGLLEARFLPVLPAGLDLSPPAALRVLTDELRADPGAPFRVIGEGDLLEPNLAALYGLADPRANDPMQPARVALVVGRSFRPRFRLGRAQTLGHRPYPVPFLGYLGVRYILTRHRETLFPPWEAAWDGEGGKLWRNPEALPLFFMPASWRRVHDPAAALAATLANEDFAAAAVAELPGAGHALEVVTQQPGPVRLRRVSANGFEMDVGSAAGGLVVSSIASCRGWRLAIDHRPARLLRVNAAFLGFLAPPGRHRATLDYRPAGWVWGLRLWCLTLVAILAAAAGRAALRRLAGPGPPQRRGRW
jgi:Bacterial membrane protein YfhO